MQKRILFISLGIVVASLLVASSYYIFIYSPQKQKANIEKVTLEIEAKVEKENKLKEAENTIANQQAKITQQEQLIEKQNADLQKTKSEVSKTNGTSAVKKNCNATAVDKAVKRYKEIDGDAKKGTYAITQYENFYNECLRENGL